MSLFCFLWVPFFFLFRRSIAGGQSQSGVWALLLGSITAIFQFFLGNLVTPGGFGFSRWLYGFIDIVCLPVLIPLLAFFVLNLLKGFSEAGHFADFALLWLIPVAALRSITWSSLNDPLLLVIAPLLWTALAVGIPFFINCMLMFQRWYVGIPAVLYILAMPVLAACAYWALFSQDTFKGVLYISAVLIPMAVSVVLDYFQVIKS